MYFKYVKGRNEQKIKERRHFPYNFVGIMQIHRSKNHKLAQATEMTIPKVKPTDWINKLSREKNIRHTNGDSLHSEESRKEERFVVRNHKEHLEILKGNKTK